MYEIKVELKMDNYLGFPYHAWVEIDVFPSDGENYPKCVGLGVNSGGHKRIITHEEALDRQWVRRATFQFTAEQNLFTTKRWNEVVEAVGKVMETKRYNLFTNNCRAFVDVFMCVYFGARRWCDHCFSSVFATGNSLKLPTLNYFIPNLKYYFQYDRMNHATKYYCINVNKVYEVDEYKFEKHKQDKLFDTYSEISDETIEFLKKYF